MKLRNPKNASEWQEAVDAANGALHLESARLYGLIAGGPAVNVERCEAILLAGKRRGIFPRPGSDVALALALARPT